MSKKEVMFDLICDLVRESYHTGRLDMLLQPDSKWDDSHIKKHLEGIKKLTENSDEEGDDK